MNERYRSGRPRAKRFAGAGLAIAGTGMTRSYADSRAASDDEERCAGVARIARQTFEPDCCRALARVRAP